MSNLSIIYLGNFPVLRWQPHPDSVKYRIYRGTTKDNLESIADTDLLQYQDSSPEANLMKKFDRVKYFYQIASVKEDGTEEKFSDIVNVYQEIKYPYAGIFKTIVRRNNLMLTRMTGEDCTFYIKRGAGQRCPDCFNEITRDVDSESPFCSTCYNTTFVGGYVQVQGRVRIRNAQEQEVRSVWGMTIESNGKVGWTANYPLLDNGDLIKTISGEIYVIDNLVRRSQKDFVTLQTFTVKTLKTTDNLYSVVV